MIVTTRFFSSHFSRLRFYFTTAFSNEPPPPPATTLPRIWNIPYPRNPYFTGQEDVLTRLTNALKAGQATAHSQPQAISGLGGIGKTQIAVEFAYRHREDYQAVLWVLADTRESLVSGYIAVAQLLELPQRNEQDQMVIIDAVKSWLQTHSSWLLILDNADELTAARDFVPPSFGGRILLTTRAQAMGRFAKGIEVEVMSHDVGALFLLRRAGLVGEDAQLDVASSSDVGTAREISEELGGLPLALDQAGAYIEENQSSLANYLVSYRKRRAVLLARRGGLVDDHPDSVAATWSLAFEKVEQRSRASADLLRLCAFLAPDAIPEEIITQGAGYLGPSLVLVAEDDLAMDEAIAPLLAYSLVRRNPKEKSLSIHRLIQAVLQDTLSEAERRLWAEQAILAINAVFSEPLSGRLPSRERLLPHVLLAAQWSDIYQINRVEVGHLFLQTGKFFHYAQAESLCRQGLAIYKQWFGTEHSKVADALTTLGNILQGPFGSNDAEAEQCYRQALGIYDVQAQPERFHGMMPIANLASLYLDQKKYILAESLCQQALAIAEQEFGSEDPRLCHQLNALADCYCEQEKYTLAEPLYQRALAIDEGVELRHEQWFERRLDEVGLRKLSLRVANALNRLAHLYFKQGKYTEAELLYQRALPIYEQQSESERWLVSPPNGLPSPLNVLANLSLEQGKYAEAELLYQRALKIREQQLGSTHPDTAQSLRNLATLYEQQGKYALAERLFQGALTIYEQTLGPDHPRTQSTRQWYVKLLRTLRRDEEADRLSNAASNEGATGP